jgi:stage II sporulation protein AA (anti-sigma F factor antagonist)
MHSVPEFKSKVIEIMEKNNLKFLILNLTGIKFIDSSGLGAILGRYRYLKNISGKVVLIGLKPQVKRIFEMSGILKLMPVYNDEITALAELNNKGGYNFA